MDLKRLTVAELQELCENNGKHPGQTKEQMIAALKRTGWYANLAKKK